MERFEDYSTYFVQEIGSKEGAVSPAITQSASFGYGDSQTGEGIFDGSVKKPLYSRVGNPTTAKLENILAKMDGGIGAECTSSGMGATTLACMSIVSCGDEIISVGGLFGGTYALFTETLTRFGVSTTFFDVDEFEAIESAITAKTKIIYLESVGNPNMRLPDIKAIANIAAKHGVVLMVDNTITPMSVKPFELGADIAVYSTTKIISGNASVLGGAAVFRAIDVEGDDKFKGERYKDIHIVKLDKDGQALVSHTIGGEKGEEAHGLARMKDGHFALVGSRDMSNGNYADYWIPQSYRHPYSPYLHQFPQ